MKTNKNKKKYDAKEAFIKGLLAEKFEVTREFVYLALRGERTSETAEEIKKEYKSLTARINNSIK